ncbi:FAD-dependent monooxygenase [Actinosynnema sp. NPDC020468]|uniref:FAD-dependent monooxygenase n=1 Tax=Actinosynnema sp. NPDC020468 TaxID=3154488 RepID=UPI0033F7A859
MHSTVVIVGAGPNGLMLAGELLRNGVEPLVLDALPERSAYPRANGLVGQVVQALDRRGVHELITGSPHPPSPASSFQFGALPLDLSGMDDNALHLLPVPQRRLSEVLEKHGGVRVHRGHQVTDLTREEDHVVLRVTGPDGPYELTAGWVVGADGGSSLVRKRSGIDFPGVTQHGMVTRSGQVCVDEPVAVPDSGQLHVPGVGLLWPGTFHRTERGVFVFGMFEPGVYRVAAIEWEQTDEPDTTEMPLAELRQAVKRVLGADLPMSEPPEPHHPALSRRSEGTNSRIADRYRRGRVLLLGDAAHVQSGIGGPGLNLGLQDALNLGWKLAAEVKGWAPEGLLDTYESERRPVGERVITHSRAQTALLSPGPNITALREVLTELLADAPAVARLSHLLSGGDTTYDLPDTGALVGKWLPDLTFTDHTTVTTLSRPGKPLLLLLDDEAADALTPIAERWSDRVELHRKHPTTPPPAAALLVRPDGYVAWSGTSPTTLEAALRTWFGDPLDHSTLGEWDVYETYREVIS